MNRILEALPGEVQRHDDEARFQDSIARALRKADIPFIREARNKVGRFDFLCTEDSEDPAFIAIEAKVKGGLNSLMSQCSRYLWNTHITGLVVATTRSIHTRIPKTLASKPVRVFWASYP